MQSIEERLSNIEANIAELKKQQWEEIQEMEKAVTALESGFPFQSSTSLAS